MAEFRVPIQLPPVPHTHTLTLSVYTTSIITGSPSAFVTPNLALDRPSFSHRILQVWEMLLLLCCVANCQMTWPPPPAFPIARTAPLSILSLTHSLSVHPRGRHPGSRPRSLGNGGMARGTEGARASEREKREAVVGRRRRDAAAASSSSASVLTPQRPRRRRDGETGDVARREGRDRGGGEEKARWGT